MQDQSPKKSVDRPGCGPITTGTQAVLKPLRQQVFEYVRASGHAARADLTRALEISPATATALTADLIAEGFLKEVEGPPRETGRGRPPVALSVPPGQGIVVGIKLSDEVHSAIVLDRAGTELGAATLSTTAIKKTTEKLLSEILDLIDRVLADAGIEMARVQAVGLGLSGLVDHELGVTHWSPALIETDVPLKALLEDRLARPVHIDNDVNLLTLAELWFGVGRTRSDFAVVTIEHGVGMGVVIGNRVFRGSRGMGMELGHTKVQLDGALCRCGRRGCLEAYIADYALVREASTALDRPLRNLQSQQAMLEALYAQARAGNEAALTIFRRAGRYLAVGLSNVIQIFDPDLIILSGARMQFEYLYADEVMTETLGLSLTTRPKPPTVEIHAWGDAVWARGAAALALDAETDRHLG